MGTQTSDVIHVVYVIIFMVVCHTAYFQIALVTFLFTVMPHFRTLPFFSFSFCSTAFVSSRLDVRLVDTAAIQFLELRLYAALNSFFLLYQTCMFPYIFILQKFQCLYERIQVTLVELSRPSPSLPEILSGIGSSVIGVDRTLKELLQDMTFADGVQARMDGIMFQKLEGASYSNPIFTLIKDYLSSL